MMNNRQLADTFTLIANLCEIKGEVIYVILAYRKASENLMTLGREASEYWKEGKLREIPGVGKAIAEKIDELLTTGKLEFLEKLKEEIPASLADWLQVPGLGPKKIALIWKTLNITTLAELETAAKNGQLRDLPGMGTKSENAILEGIASLARTSGTNSVGAGVSTGAGDHRDTQKGEGSCRSRTSWQLEKDAFHRRRSGYFGGGKGFIRCDGSVHQSARCESCAWQR